MTRNGNPQESASIWERKYLELLERSQALENNLHGRIDVLLRALLAVSRTGSTLNSKLNAELAMLRSIAAKDSLDARIPGVLKNLEKSLDHTAAEKMIYSRRIMLHLQRTVQQLLELGLPFTLKRKLYRLSKSLRHLEDPDSALPKLIQNLADYQQQVLVVLTANVPPFKPGWLERLFFSKRRKPKAPSTDLGQTESREQTGAILLELLDKLEVPDEYQETSYKLRTDIEHRLSPETLAEHLQTVANITFRTIADLHKQFSLFLHRLDTQLEAVHVFYDAHQSSDHQRRDSQTGLIKSLRELLADTRNNIGNPVDMHSLQRTLSAKLNGIETTLTHYTARETEREQELQQLMEQLAQRLQDLEAGSKALQSRLDTQSRLARVDSLTGLANRRACLERINMEFSRRERYQMPLSLIMADVTGLQGINEQYGRASCDKLLRVTAQTLSRNLRESDFIARDDTGEFIIVLANTSLAAAEAAANKLRATIARSGFNFKGKEITVTLCCGITEFTKTDTIESALARASEALHKEQNKKATG
jgi:diguanylate cyclase